MAWKIVNFNPFASRPPEDEEPTGPVIPPGANVDRERQAPLPVDLTKFGESYNPFQAFQQTDEKAKASPAAPRTPEAERGASWSDALDPQQYKEAAKGIVPGAIQFTGTTMQGLAAAPAVGQANAFKFGQAQQNVWDRIDRGENVPEMEDAAGYQHMNAEQRRQLRADASKAEQEFKPTVLAEQPLYQAGEAVKDYAKTVLPAAPGYETAVGRQLGEGLGSMLAGLPFGAIGRIPATIFFGAGGAGEAGTRAIAYDQAEKRAGRPGLTQEQINGAAIWGIAPGTTDLLPVEVILGRLRVPEPLKKPLAKAIGRIGGQAFIEGVQEGGQAFLQNAIAQDYNPNQGLTEGVAGEAGIGSGVGGIAQLGKELGGLALAGFGGGRRAALGQSGQAPDAGAGDPFAQPLQPAPTSPAGEITTTGPIDVEFEDLVPADRRLPSPVNAEVAQGEPSLQNRPAQQSGMEPPLSPTVSPQGRGWALPPAPAANTAPRGVLPPPSPSSSVPGSVDAAPAAPSFQSGNERMALAPDIDELGFTSKAYEAARGLKQDKGTSDQMLAQLESAGTKNAEIEATGLDKWLLGPEVAAQRRQVLGIRNQVNALHNEAKTNPARAPEIQAQLAQIQPQLAQMEQQLKANMRASAKPVSKQEIVKFLAGARTPLMNKRYGAQSPEYQRVAAERERLANRIYSAETEATWQDTQSMRDQLYDLDKELDSLHDPSIEAAKWSQYSLDPANPSYQEELLHLPRGALRTVPTPEQAQEAKRVEQSYRDKIAEIEAKHDGWISVDHPDARVIERLMREMQDAVAKAAPFEDVADYQSGHWRSTPNVVAHIRSQILTDTKGRKVFNIDELQSDWGQTVREDSRDETKIAGLKSKIAEVQERWDSDSMLKELRPEADEFIRSIHGDSYHTSQREHALWVIERDSEQPLEVNQRAADLRGAIVTTNGMYEPEIKRLRSELDQEQRKGNTPSHPLVNTTDQWTTTGLRRAIQMAAEAGADGITITPGRVQKERFSLGSTINNADVYLETDDGVGARRVVLNQGARRVANLSVDANGIVTQADDPLGEAKGQPLSAVIGERGADAIMRVRRNITLGLEELEVGGEGMTATYDQMYPRALLKLLQKLDPSIKPEKTKLEPTPGMNVHGAMSEFPFFPLTEKAKQKLDAEGQPMFALQGFYSPAIKAVEKIKQEKASAEQWWSMITKTPGVRQEELAWMGLKEWLDDQKNPEYGPGKPEFFIDGRSIEQLFPDPAERTLVRGRLVSGEAYVGLLHPTEYRGQPGSIATHIRVNMPEGASPEAWQRRLDIARWMESLSPDQITKGELQGPLIRQPRTSIPKADILDFMAQHEIELEDDLRGSGNSGGVSEEEIEERAREIEEEMSEEQRDEDYNEWLRENDPELYTIEVEEYLPRAHRETYDKAKADWRAGLEAWYEFIAQQLTLPGVDTHPNKPQLKDYLPNPWLDEDGDLIEPVWEYTLSHPHGRDYEDTDFATEDDAREAAEAKLEDLKEKFERDKERWYDNWETPHHIWGEAMRQAREELGDPDEDNEDGEGLQYRKYAIKGGEAYRELLITFPDMERTPSTHWSKREIVHMRFDTRYKEGGGDRVLLIHEIQSDIHQRARDFGYGQEGADAARAAIDQQGWTAEMVERNTELADQLAELNAQGRALWRPDPEFNNTVDHLPPENEAAHREIEAKMAPIQKEMTQLTDQARKRKAKADTYFSTFGAKGAPEAPYKGNAWWELAFKRMVQYAVEENFDAIAITTPKQIMDATYTPETAATQFYGQNLPKFAEKYLKKWGVKPDRAKLKDTPEELHWELKEGYLDRAKLRDFAERLHGAMTEAGTPDYEWEAKRIMDAIVALRDESNPIPDNYLPKWLAQNATSLQRYAQNGFWTRKEGSTKVDPIMVRREVLNPIYRITDPMRDDIKANGQPLALGPASTKADYELRRNIGNMLKIGRAVRIPHADAVLKVIEPYLDVVPDDTSVSVLTKVEPKKGSKERIIAHFKTHLGEEYTLEGDWNTLRGRRAWLGRDAWGNPSMFFARYHAPGDGDGLLIGEMRHEMIHALIESGNLPRSVAARLLSHAKALRLLESDIKTYLKRIGSPNATYMPDGVPIIDYYEEAYKNHRDPQASIDEEYIAHLAELYSHGELMPQEVEPVRDILDDIFAGEYSKEPRNRPAGGRRTLHAMGGREREAFAGPKALTANPIAMGVAQKMEADGVDRKDIWMRTGWFKAADGRWKFEIDDSKANWLVVPALRSHDGDFQGKLGSMVMHSKLFRAYPELREMPLIFSRGMPLGNGGFSWKSNDPKLPEQFILVGVKGYKGEPGDLEEMLSVVLHEVQHWIQRKEGFAAGSSPLRERAGFEERRKAGVLTPQDMAVMELPQVKAASGPMVQLAKALIARPDDKAVQEAADYFADRYLSEIAYALYQREAGEVEAREVQHRRGFNTIDRGITWPAPVDYGIQHANFGDGEEKAALAGMRAIGAPQGRKAQAERMEGRGAKPDQVWEQTGMARGPDTKWRWEIDDSRARITNLEKILAGAKASPGFFKRIMGGQQKSAPVGGIQKQTNIPLINLLDHPQLYSAYPFLRQMRVDLTYGPGVEASGALKTRGGDKVTVYKPITVNASTPEEIKSVLMHEIQHYIQNREGFAKGSDMPKSRPTVWVDEGQSNALYDPGRNDAVMTSYGRNRQTLLKMTRPESYALEILEEFEALDRAKASKDAEAIEMHEGNIRRFGRRLEDAMLVRPEDYADSAGEWEAREVQNRLNMPAAEREKRSPFANAPANLGNTSGQTRDYSKAYDEVMRRAGVFKDIKDRWKQRQPVIPGVDVVRDGEFNLEYGNGNFAEGTDPSYAIVNVGDYDNTAHLILAKSFIDKPYPEQKRIMDGIMRDLKKRNIVVTGAKPNSYEVQDQDIPFWKRYDPTKIAFDLRLYRDEIMEKAKERYGDDVEVEIDSDIDAVYVSTPQMKADAEQAALDYRKLEKQLEDTQEKMQEKYGWQWFGAMTKQEKDRYEDIVEKKGDLDYARDHTREKLDLDFLFEGRSPAGRPNGVDYETWMRAVAEEQLLRMGKMPRPGEEVDFEDLVPAQ